MPRTPLAARPRGFPPRNPDAVTKLEDLMEEEEINSPLAARYEEIINDIKRERSWAKQSAEVGEGLRNRLDHHHDMALELAARIVHDFTWEYGLEAEIIAHKRELSASDRRKLGTEGVARHRSGNKPKRKGVKKNVSKQDEAAGNGDADSGARQG